MKKLFSLTAVFIVMLIITAALLINNCTRKDNSGSYIVAFNEIEHLAAKGDPTAVEAAEELKEQIISDNRHQNIGIPIIIMCGADVVMLLVISLYCGFAIIRPFDKLTDFAERIALGDMDIPLDYDRSNYFGKFTWAFDNMRREITKARACERETTENNKTVIASLSHDIKTPAASIRAYAEALELGMDASPEKRSKYISVIMRKCDEVAKLTDDMFLHSISDLDKLKISAEKIEITEFMNNTVKELSANDENIIYEQPYFTAFVGADRGRTAQIAENLINNAWKYAKTPVRITLTRDDDFVYMHFRDFGKGIPDEDMPFICNKFYRGKNCGEENGSGLGLFIVKYIAQQSGGDVKLKNHDDGLEVTVSLPMWKE